MSKGGGGGGSSGPQEVVQTTSNLPEYARPYFEEMLGRTMYETTRPYEAYPGQRLAEFDPYETQAMQGFGEMTAPGQIQTATDIATRIGQPGAGAPSAFEYAKGFDPGTVSSAYTAGTFDPGYAAGDYSAGYQAGSFDPGYQAREYTPGYQAGTFDPGYVARELGQDYTARDLQSQYAGDIETGPGFTAGTVADAATLEQYMNPYQQLVTDIEKREARRASEIQGADISQQAAQAGGLGGYREAIMQAERERNLGQQLQDIQAQGGQQAYNQALQAFEADRAARLQEAQFGLTAGEARDRARQEAERFRQSAFGTTEQARQEQQNMAIRSFEAGETARQRAADLGLSAQQQEDAARRAQEEFGFSAFQAGEAAKQEAARLGLSAQEQEEAARRAQEEFGLSAFQTSETARQRAGELGLSAQEMEESARQTQETLNLNAFQAGEAAKQEAARLGLSAQEQEEAARRAENEYKMQAQQANISSAEVARRLGLEGIGLDQQSLSQQLDAARLLGGLGGQEQQMAIERLMNMQTAGQIRREFDQRGLDIGYQDFLRQQAFPREQLAYFSNILRGLPISPGQTTATFGQQPGLAQQALGAGIGGVGLYRALGG